jgi:hypothetical protein
MARPGAEIPREMIMAISGNRSIASAEGKAVHKDGKWSDAGTPGVALGRSAFEQGGAIARPWRCILKTLFELNGRKSPSSALVTISARVLDFSPPAQTPTPMAQHVVFLGVALPWDTAGQREAGSP